jgi:hypothetical protein
MAKHQWLSDLYGDNFLAVCDVLTDIRLERQLTGDTLDIPIFQQLVKYEQLLPADTPGLRDRYCELRWKAARLLEVKGALSNVDEIDSGFHRWDNLIRVTVREPLFSQIAKLLEQEFTERTKEDVPPTSTDEAVVLLRKTLRRFHGVALQLTHRHQNRETLQVTDEYDVQDLLHALLRLNFDDVRPEEWTPSYAGKSSRVDFFLKPEQIIVEVKKTRTGLSNKEVGDQLIIDIHRYASLQGCKTLICFVYDPAGLILNPRGFESDLGGSRDGLIVEVIVTPRHV